ncbi:MAG: glycosyltransferase family 9 protein [Candidatus Omnitrophota bacterium]
MKIFHFPGRQLNLKKMHQIDFWVGIPLCALMTFWDRICRFIFHPPKRSVRRILLIKLFEVGAIVQAYPLLTWLRKTYPDAQISFLVFEKNTFLLRVFNNLISFHHIYGIPDESFWCLVSGTYKIWRDILKEDFDVVIDLEFFSRFTSLLSYLSGAERRVGFHRYSFEGLYRGDLYTHKVPYNPLLHCSKMYLALGKMVSLSHMNAPGISVSVDDSEMVFPYIPPSINMTKRLQEKFEKLGLGANRLYLVNPGEGVLPLREWPLNNYNLLVRMILIENPSNVVVIIGRNFLTGKDIDLHQMVDNPRCFNWSKEIDIEELIALFHMAKILVCNDGGLSHLASVTPLKTIVLFGPESPQVFSPAGIGTRVIFAEWPCSPCLSVLNHRISSCRENYCLQAIPLERVFSIVMENNPDN